MEVNTLDEAMQEAVVSVDTANLTQQADLTTNDILPPINTDAKVTCSHGVARQKLTALSSYTLTISFTRVETYSSCITYQTPTYMFSEHILSILYILFTCELINMNLSGSE